MTGFLLDTNVVSELTKSRPNPAVVTFLSENEDLWLSVILVHEIEYGLHLLPQGRRRNRLLRIHTGILETYSDRILALDRVAAEWSAKFRAQAQSAGRAIDLGDTLIAGIAKSHDLMIATRNAADFDHLEVDIVNPWEYIP